MVVEPLAPPPEVAAPIQHAAELLHESALEQETGEAQANTGEPVTLPPVELSQAPPEEKPAAPPNGMHPPEDEQQTPSRQEVLQPTRDIPRDNVL
jgi:hypothetical protein